MPRMNVTASGLPRPVGAHRVAFALPTPRMFLGAMPKDSPTLIVSEVVGGAMHTRGQIGLMLPAVIDFDVAVIRGGELLVAYEEHGGAVASLRFAAPLGGALPNVPARDRIASELRPRFVRGDPASVVISEDEERAVLIRTGTPGRRQPLRPCFAATAAMIGGGLAAVTKTLRPGAMVGGIPAGTLMLQWHAETGRPPLTLLGGRDVFDFDMTAIGNHLIIAAITHEGPVLLIVTTDGVIQQFAVDGLPAGIEGFSPALHAIPGKVTLALLASAPSWVGGPTMLLAGTTSF
jgi:hypothetical protein